MVRPRQCMGHITRPTSIHTLERLAMLSKANDRADCEHDCQDQRSPLKAAHRCY
jgi:hypothetical protein